MFDVGIIGTTGRGEKIKYLSLDKFNKMVKTAENFIEKNLYKDWSKINLVSGGAAWADHVAIKLHNNHPEAKMTLYFPCKFDIEKKQFIDNGNTGFFNNPGKSANRYHIYFKTKTGINSLKEISYAIGHKNVKAIDKYKGFKQRNLYVGKVEILLAFTFGDDEPSTSGTKDTWDKSKAKFKEHFNINTL